MMDKVMNENVVVMNDKIRWYWNKLLLLGADKTEDLDTRQRIIMLNGLVVAASIGTVLATIIFAIAGWQYGWLSLIFLPVYLGVLYLNVLGKPSKARLLVVIVPFFITFLLSLMFRRTGQEFGLIAVACNSILFFRQVRSIVLAFAAGLVLYIVSRWYDLSHPFIPNAQIDYPVVHVVVAVCCISFIMLQFIISRSITQRYSEQLKAANEEIRSTIEELSSINEHLDEIVKKKSQELQSYIEAIDVSIFSMTISPRGKILKVNDYFLRASGYEKEALVNHSFRVLDSGYHSKIFFREMGRQLKYGQLWQGEIQGKTQAGEIFWIEAVIMPMRSPQHNTIRKLLLLGLPITDRKVAEEERNKTIKIFEAIAFRTSHNVRGPLTRILGLSHLVRKNMVQKHEINTIAEKFTEAAYELDIVTRDLTAYINNYDKFHRF